MKNLLGIDKEIKVDGILVPHTWSKGNRVTTIAIHTAGEQEYIIDPNHKTSKELKNLVGKRVKVTGQICKTKSGPRRLIVRTYEIFDW